MRRMSPVNWQRMKIWNCSQIKFAYLHVSFLSFAICHSQIQLSFADDFLSFSTCSYEIRIKQMLCTIQIFVIESFESENEKKESDKIKSNNNNNNHFLFENRYFPRSLISDIQKIVKRCLLYHSFHNFRAVRSIELMHFQREIFIPLFFFVDFKRKFSVNEIWKKQGRNFLHILNAEHWTLNIKHWAYERHKVILYTNEITHSKQNKENLNKKKLLKYGTEHRTPPSDTW